MTNDKKILVVGVGNILLSDEGIGVRVIQELEKYPTAEDIELLDAGTDIFTIMSSDTSYRTIIVVDAIRGNKTPGTVFCYPVVEDLNVETDNNSIHQIQIVEALKLIKRTIEKFHNTNIKLIGVEPAQIEYGVGLSTTIEQKVETLVELVKKEIKNARSIARPKYN